MKTIKNVALAILGVVFAFHFAVAQNYKAPAIDASGKLTDAQGKHIGTFKEGAMMSHDGKKMATIDAEGNLVDAAGKKMGKAEKNGNFKYFTKETPDGKNFIVGAPAQGICEVKDDKGKVVMLVHENYKAQAACAYHCAQMKKDGKEMKMNNEHSTH